MPATSHPFLDALAAALMPSINAARILILLGDGESRAMGEIADILDLNSTNVTTIADTLERRGYVQRLRHPHDRRAVLLRLAPAGRTLLDSLPA